MESNLITSKPLFEYTDIELKAIAFDIHENIKIQENNLNLIRTELNRRIHSSVVATVSAENLASINK